MSAYSAYSIGSFIGYFAIMFALMGIAIATAKRNICWLFYAVGGILQFLSLLGRGKTLETYSWLLDESSYNAGTTLRWVVYIVVMVATLVIILKKKEKHRVEEYYRNRTTHQSEPKPPASANAPGWQCDCGRANADYVMTCTCGITKKEMKLKIQSTNTTK